MILEDDLVMGTFTNTEKYLSDLKESINKFFPKIEFILQLDNKSIKENFELLRKKFIKTHKRFWLFLDHDIKFISPDTIRIALITLIRDRFAMVGCYSTYDPNYIIGSDPLIAKETGWVPGYFQLVDSRRVGHITVDFNLPDDNTAIDTSYSVAIKTEGYKIGIAPTVVYHLYKKVWMNLDAYEKTNTYVRGKWGQFYFDCTNTFEGIVGGIPNG